MTNEAAPTWGRYRDGSGAKPGDLVGYALNVYRDGKVVGTKIMMEGLVTGLYRPTPKGHWRLKVIWPVHDRIRAHVYFGNHEWVYPRQVVLLKRAEDNEKR